MRTADERVDALHLRMNTRRREKALRKARTAGASAVAVSLALVLLFAVYISRVQIQTPVPATVGATASIFADHASLGYVVVALLAFCLGALITILCQRLKKRADEEASDGGKH